MNDIERPFVAALGFRVLTPLYDGALRLMGGESRWRRAFVRQVAPGPNERILDLGCGTGSLMLELTRQQPAAYIVGLDADPQTLTRAQAKLAKAGRNGRLVEGFADNPPRDKDLVPESFDKAVTSLFLHHLSRDGKRAALANAAMLLKPGGELHIADWGEARDWLQRVRFLTIQLLDGFATTGDNVHGLLPFLIGEAGFVDVMETTHARTRFGPFAMMRAKKAAEPISRAIDRGTC